MDEYGEPYVDGNSGEQVSVKNVLILRTGISNISGDDKGRMAVQTVGSGSGYFLCDGTVQEISWSRASDGVPMSYTDASGNPLKLGVGHSYVCIVSNYDPVEVS